MSSGSPWACGGSVFTLISAARAVNRVEPNKALPLNQITHPFRNVCEKNGASTLDILGVLGVSAVNRFSDLQYHRHNQRPPLRLPRDVALQVSADFLFDHAVVGFLFGAGGVEGLHDDLAGAFDHAVFAECESARHNLGRGFDAAGELVDGNDRHHETVFAEVTAVFDDEVFDHVGAGAGIDADAADVDASGLACAVFVDFEHVSTLNQQHAADRAMHGRGQIGM